MQTATIQLPPKLLPIFGPERGAARYRALYGGRGSGKSATAALMASVWGYAEPLRILCAREFQVSIAESFHAELKAAIQSRPWLDAHYEIGKDYLRGNNGTEFIFRGIRRNEQSIKSLAKIDLTILEEAEDIPETSWLALEATVCPGFRLFEMIECSEDRSLRSRRLRSSRARLRLSAESRC